VVFRAGIFLKLNYIDYDDILT